MKELIVDITMEASIWHALVEAEKAACRPGQARGHRYNQLGAIDYAAELAVKGKVREALWQLAVYNPQFKENL